MAHRCISREPFRCGVSIRNSSYHVASFIFIAFVYLFYITFLNAKGQMLHRKLPAAVPTFASLSTRISDRIIYCGMYSFLFVFFLTTRVIRCDHVLRGGVKPKYLKVTIKLHFCLFLNKMQFFTHFGVV